jgi:molybdate transport system substrate-binding protein
MKGFVRSLFLVLIIFTLWAMSARAGDVSLSVAASLREAVTELSANFSKANPGVKFQSNFGASGTLAKQIENGAPADLFFSANLEWMDYLKEKKLVDEKNISTFAHNTLVFVGKPNLKVGSIQEVARLERIAIGSPKSVPAGEYATQAFKKSGVENQLEKKLVMARDVRECLLYADRGEVDGAFVYRTDAEEMAKNVKILFTVPQELYPRVTYPAALTIAGSKKAEAAAFFKFLQTSDAKAVLVKHGFVVK